MKVVFDSKLILSAFFIPGSFQDRILKKLLAGSFTHITSVPILREMDRFLLYAFKESKESRKKVLDFIKDVSEIVYPVNQVNVIKTHPLDNLIFEIAEEVKPDYIVSGDKKHILPIKEFHGIPVLSPPIFSALL